MSNVKSVLFVCTGNSCRSVMAEALLKKYLRDLGKDDIKVTSAGVAAMPGMPPTKETLDVLIKEGVETPGLGSRPINAAMIRDADLILVMEDIHKERVLDLVPEAAGKTYLLKEFKNPGTSHDEEGEGIPDPIGRPMEFYRYVLKLIKKEIERIAKLL